MRHDDGYLLKFDGLRGYSGLWWTAVGPDGRLGDVATREEAMKLIEQAAPIGSVLTTPHMPKHLGGPCLYWTIEVREPKASGRERA